MITLTDFLLARIADDERAAQCVTSVVASASFMEPMDAAVLDVSAFSTARVLAECEAKRRIVALAEASYEVNALRLPMDDSPIMRALALPYADHPEYRKEWKP